MRDSHALIVGIADYAHLPGLPAAVRDDARAVHELLIDPLHGGYPAGNAALLLDRAATRGAVLDALVAISKRTPPAGSVVVYFSGHGGRVVSDASAGEYLLTADTAARPADQLARTAISGADFTAAVRETTAAKVLIMFDCCHSAGLGQVKAPLLKAGLSEGYYERLAAGRGIAVMASSRDDEYSYVLPGSRHSLFTGHLLDGLRGGVPAADGLIRVFDLFEYVQPRVTHDHPRQHPVFKAHLEENFPVALRAEGRTDPGRPTDEDGFRFDAYISYTDLPPDSAWVWDVLVPRLEREGLRVAVAGASGDPGVPHVVNAGRGIRAAKRTVIVLSQAYLADHVADFDNTMAQSLGIREGAFRILPLKIEPIDEEALPTRLGMLTTLDLAHPQRAAREFDRLIQALRAPLPRRG